MRAVSEPLTCNFFGGAEGIRTPDPLHAMEVRYQLRYSPLTPYPPVAADRNSIPAFGTACTGPHATAEGYPNGTVDGLVGLVPLGLRGHDGLAG
jgi:hypothetical protein